MKLMSFLPPELTEGVEFIEAVLAGIGEVDILCRAFRRRASVDLLRAWNSLCTTALAAGSSRFPASWVETKIWLSLSSTERSRDST